MPETLETNVPPQHIVSQLQHKHILYCWFSMSDLEPMTNFLARKMIHVLCTSHTLLFARDNDACSTPAKDVYFPDFASNSLTTAYFLPSVISSPFRRWDLLDRNCKSVYTNYVYFCLTSPYGHTVSPAFDLKFTRKMRAVFRPLFSVYDYMFSWTFSICVVTWSIRPLRGRWVLKLELELECMLEGKKECGEWHIVDRTVSWIICVDVEIRLCGCWD